jgi:hypothetical protein
MARRLGPTERDVEDLCRLRRAAGSNAEFQGWCKVAWQCLKENRGRPTLDRRSHLLGAAIRAKLARRDVVDPKGRLRDHYEQVQREAGRFDPRFFGKHFGKNPDRAADRVLKKLRKDTLTEDDWRVVDWFVDQVRPTKKLKPRSRI